MRQLSKRNCPQQWQYEKCQIQNGNSFSNARGHSIDERHPVATPGVFVFALSQAFIYLGVHSGQ
jgi:hypothetical protein